MHYYDSTSTVILQPLTPSSSLSRNNSLSNLSSLLVLIIIFAIYRNFLVNSGILSVNVLIVSCFVKNLTINFLAKYENDQGCLKLQCVKLSDEPESDPNVLFLKVENSTKSQRLKIGKYCLSCVFFYQNIRVCVYFKVSVFFLSKYCLIFVSFYQNFLCFPIKLSIFDFCFFYQNAC